MHVIVHKVTGNIAISSFYENERNARKGISYWFRNQNRYNKDDYAIVELTPEVLKSLIR